MSDNLAIEIARHRRTQERLAAETERADESIKVMAKAIKWIEDDPTYDHFMFENWYHEMKNILAKTS